MSNLEQRPRERTCESPVLAGTEVQVLEAREVPLGGPRAMPVQRTLPQRVRSLIGAWCFADHYGPDDVAATGGMRVAGHPHTGLQTVSWLFDGEIEHRDTLGTHALVRPGEMNLMTSGSGIAHSEYSTASTRSLRGVQLWVALPDRHRGAGPAFVHHAPPVTDVDGARVLTFLGSLAGATSPVETFSPLLGAELTVPAGRRLVLDVERGFEHGVLVDDGQVSVCGEPVARDRLAYLPLGRSRIELETPAGSGARVLLLGGEPLGERIVMWWNFIGRSHDEIVEFRRQWQQERADPRSGGSRRFGRLPAEWSTTLPAPELPNARLTTRG